jgi:superfamily II DNA/RNA helicase
MAAIRMGIFNCRNLRYLIIDEADDLLKDDSANLARRDCKDVISYIIGQRGETLKFQIIFVSASLKTEDIQELVFDCIQK